MGPALLRARVDRRAEANTSCFLSRARSAPVLSCSFWTSPGWPRRFAARSERRFPEGLPPPSKGKRAAFDTFMPVLHSWQSRDVSTSFLPTASCPASCARSLCDFVPPQLHLLAVARVLFRSKRRFCSGRSGDLEVKRARIGSAPLGPLARWSPWSESASLRESSRRAEASGGAPRGATLCQGCTGGRAGPQASGRDKEAPRAGGAGSAV